MLDKAILQEMRNMTENGKDFSDNKKETFFWFSSKLFFMLSLI